MMIPLLSEAEYQQIYQTLSSTERGQAFLNTFAAKHNSPGSKKRHKPSNRLSDIAYSVAENFSGVSQKPDQDHEHSQENAQEHVQNHAQEHVQDLDDFEHPDELSSHAADASANSLPDIGQLSANDDETDMVDLMVHPENNEIDFEPGSDDQPSPEQPAPTSDEAAMNNDLTLELSELKARMVNLEVKLSKI